MITLRGSYYPFFIWEGKDDQYSTENSDMKDDVSDEQSQDDESGYIDASQMESDLYLEEAVTDGQEETVDGESAAPYGDGSMMEESHMEEEQAPQVRRRKN